MLASVRLLVPKTILPFVRVSVPVTVIGVVRMIPPAPLSVRLLIFPVNNPVGIEIPVAFVNAIVALKPAALIAPEVNEGTVLLPKERVFAPTVRVDALISSNPFTVTFAFVVKFAPKVTVPVVTASEGFLKLM